LEKKKKGAGALSGNGGNGDPPTIRKEKGGVPGGAVGVKKKRGGNEGRLEETQGGADQAEHGPSSAKEGEARRNRDTIRPPNRSRRSTGLPRKLNERGASKTTKVGRRPFAIPPVGAPSGQRVQKRPLGWGGKKDSFQDGRGG